MDCIDYEEFMTLFAAALLKHSAGCAQAGQGRNDQQRIGHIVAGLGNVSRNSRRGRRCGRLCRGGRGCGGGSRRRYRRDRSDGGGRCRGRRGGAFLPAVVVAVAAAGVAAVAAVAAGGATVAGIIGAWGNLVCNHSGQGDDAVIIVAMDSKGSKFGNAYCLITAISIARSVTRNAPPGNLIAIICSQSRQGYRSCGGVVESIFCGEGSRCFVDIGAPTVVGVNFRGVAGSTSRIISIIEPTLVILLSLVVGIILLSVLLPLMGIMSGIG